MVFSCVSVPCLERDFRSETWHQSFQQARLVQKLYYLLPFAVKDNETPADEDEAKNLDKAAGVSNVDNEVEVATDNPVEEEGEDEKEEEDEEEDEDEHPNYNLDLAEEELVGNLHQARLMLKFSP